MASASCIHGKKHACTHACACADIHTHTYACARFYTLVYAPVYANICVHICVYVYRCAKAVVRCAKRLSAARPPWRESGCPLPSKAVVRKAVVRCPLSESGCPLLTLNVASRCWRKRRCLNCVWWRLCFLMINAHSAYSIQGSSPQAGRDGGSSAPWRRRKRHRTRCSALVTASHGARMINPLVLTGSGRGSAHCTNNASGRRNHGPTSGK